MQFWDIRTLRLARRAVDKRTTRVRRTCDVLPGPPRKCHKHFKILLSFEVVAGLSRARPARGQLMHPAGGPGLGFITVCTNATHFFQKMRGVICRGPPRSVEEVLPKLPTAKC